MTVRTVSLTIACVGLCLLAATIVYPVVAVIIRTLASSETAIELWWPSERQWTLLGKTTLLACGAALVAMLLAVPAVFVLGGIRADRDSVFWSAIVPLPLILPPMVYAFGWQRLRTTCWPDAPTPGPIVSTMLLWASWAWPIPALIVGSGWSRIGSSIHESALLVTSARRAFLQATFPVLRRHAIASFIVLIVIFMAEYSIPHSQGLVVTATELLAVAQVGHVGDVLRQSWPTVAVIVLLAGIARLIWPPLEAHIEHHRPPASRNIGSRLAVALIVVASVVVPLTALAARPNLPSEMGEAFRTYSRELIGTVLVCLSAAVMIGWTGVATMAIPSVFVRRVCIAMIVLTGLVPGALVGECIIAAYQPISPIYNHWPIVAIGLSARFAWVGLLATWIATRSTPRDVLAHAAMEGADFATSTIFLRVLHHWPAIVAGVLIATALTVAEVPVVTMVQVPQPRMLSVIIIEKFHRFETGMLAAICVWVVACAVPGAILGISVRRRMR